MSLFRREEQPRERSPEERERQRAQREARRAGRAPAPEPEPPPEPSEPPATEPVAEPEHPPDPDPEPEPIVPSRRDRAEVLRERLAERARARHVPRPGRRAAQVAAGDAASGRRAGPRGPTTGRGRAFAAAGAVLAVAGLWFLISLIQPFHGAGHGRVDVTIPPGSGAGKVAHILASDGVVSSAFFFELRVTIAGHRSDLRAGHYVLERGMSYGAAINALTSAPAGARTVDVLVPEGRWRREIATIARADGLRGSYLAASARSPLLDPVRYGAPRSTPSLEGFLFPATYQLRAGAPAASLVAEQLAAFKRSFAGVSLTAAKRVHLTAYDVLTIASMVEAEAQTAHDRPLIAAVIYNRLHDRMPLGIDATTRYEFGERAGALTAAQLAAPSPYNTRSHRGLPPTPIGNPGLVSIQAAANPAHVPYLYFVVKPCGNGEHVFSSTYRQFQADAARYTVARALKGGRSPSRCG